MIRIVHMYIQWNAYSETAQFPSPKRLEVMFMFTQCLLFQRNYGLLLFVWQLLGPYKNNVIMCVEQCKCFVFISGRSFHLQVLVSSVNATLLDRNSPHFTVCGAYFGHSSEGNTVAIDCPKNTIGKTNEYSNSFDQK